VSNPEMRFLKNKIAKAQGFENNSSLQEHLERQPERQSPQLLLRFNFLRSKESPQRKNQFSSPFFLPKGL